MLFGEKLRQLRKQKGLTQAELAKQAGLGLRTIIGYEKGETYPQNRELYAVLAGLLGVHPDYLRCEDSFVIDGPLTEEKLQTVNCLYEATATADDTSAVLQNMMEYIRRLQQEPLPPDVRLAGALMIRPASPADLPKIIDLYKTARLAEDSWCGAEPDFVKLCRDLEQQKLFAVCRHEGLCGAFSLDGKDAVTDPELLQIDWEYPQSYVFLRDMAGGDAHPDVYARIIEFSKSCYPHVLTVVPAGNKEAEKLLPKCGFTRRGVITRATDGKEMAGYEYLLG